MSAYPPAPWSLGGWGIGTIGLVDSAAAEAFVPAGARVVSVLPGKTVGGLFFFSFDRGSLTYRELGVASALVRIGSRFAVAFSRSYVDGDEALAGGHEIWGARRERARFEIGHDIGLTSIDVRQGTREVCRLRASVPTSGLRLPLRVPSFGSRDDAFLFFTNRMAARISRARVAVDIPPDGELAPLGLTRPRLALRFENLSLVVPAPRVVQRELERRTAPLGSA